MYAKIALGNVRKSFRDFSVFFLTLAFGVCVFYAFGSITDQAAVIQMGEDQRRMVQALTDILSGVSVFVVIILGFLVVYANRFLIRRRTSSSGFSSSTPTASSSGGASASLASTSRWAWTSATCR